MRYQVDASVQLALPENPVEMAETMGKIAAAWQVFTDTVKPFGAEARYEFNQARAKPQRGKPKPKLVEQPAVPELVA